MGFEDVDEWVVILGLVGVYIVVMFFDYYCFIFVDVVDEFDVDFEDLFVLFDCLLKCFFV